MLKKFDAVIQRSGKAVPGAVITFFTFPAGTPVVPYSDDGVTPINEAVTTNADGEYAVYLPRGRYTIVTTVKGVEVDRRDDESVGDPELSTDLASTDSGKGAALISFSQSNSYPAGTLGLQAKGLPSVQAAPFNAVGDGVAADLTAFNLAKDGATTKVVPAGTYVLSASLNAGPGAFLVSPNSEFSGAGIAAAGGAPDLSRGFYKEFAGGANIWRFQDRMMIGDAAMSNAKLIGFGGIDTDFGATYLIRDATVGVIQQYGLIGYGSLVKTSKYTGGLQQSTISFGGMVLNDRAGATGRVLYTETRHRPGALVSAGGEITGKDQGGVENTRTPYGGTSGGTYGLLFVAGGDPSYDGPATNNCNTAIHIGGVDWKWNKGLLFDRLSITGADGTPGGGIDGHAVEMAYGQGLTWYSSNGSFIGGRIVSVATAAADQHVEQQFDNNALNFTHVDAATLFGITHVASGANGLRVTDAVAGAAPIIAPIGADTNIDLNLTPKGNGATVTPRLTGSGAVSAPAWTTAGIGIRTLSQTFTDTTSSGVVASMYVHNLAAPTVAATSPTTFTNAYTLDIAGPPAPGSNVTITTAGALRVGSGLSLFNGAVVMNGGLSVAAGTVNLNTTADIRIGGAASTLAFYAGTPQSKLSVTGSRGGNAALASLLTHLASYGLINDTSTA